MYEGSLRYTLRGLTLLCFFQMLHYFVKDFFAPVIASPYQEGGKFKLYVVSDLMKVIAIIKNWVIV